MVSTLPEESVNVLAAVPVVCVKLLLRLLMVCAALLNVSPVPMFSRVGVNDKGPELNRLPELTVMVPTCN